jgi:Glycosyl hydrolase family 3 N terminal domain
MARPDLCEQNLPRHPLLAVLRRGKLYSAHNGCHESGGRGVVQLGVNQSEAEMLRQVQARPGSQLIPQGFMKSDGVSRGGFMTRREFASMLAGAGMMLNRLRMVFGQASADVEPKGEMGAPARADGEVANLRNSKLPTEQRTADLLRRMTLEEKVEQLRGGRTSIYGILDTTGKFTDKSIHGDFRQIYAMIAHLSPHDQAVYRNALQRYAVEKTRLGIPQIFQGIALHGYMGENGTSFPPAIALAGTWDPELIQKVFTAAADEAPSAGIDQIFAPIINLGRDPRWGRTEQTYGEDPYLSGRLGVATIKGLQGENFMIDRHAFCGPRPAAGWP